ncbi:MAG: DsbA family protein [Reyranella sp.]|uniref:DsbA family protein n=1 Tax=Reyranella sp. TaxID=1929291 RepID=UPI0011F6D4F6|nr:DsbA family protein [Reyranella sp.]TAJ37373.1 MAG: DsbA family protein [Reyranella sp.]
MRSILLALCAALIGGGALLAAGATTPARLAAPAATADAGDKGALGKRIREYLIANPEVLVEAMQELERKQDNQRDAVAQKAIRQHKAELLADPDSPSSGNANADVVIVDFNDYQCPYCKRAHQAVKQVVAADGKVKVIYKDLPILGEPSRIAALAALAAVKQGKHLAFHDALMETSAKLDRARILEIAASVGLDVALLEKDMDDPKFKQLIDRNMALAGALGVRGTPAFVIGDQFVPGAVDAAALKQLIADARKR